MAKKIGFIDTVHPSLSKSLKEKGFECIDLSTIDKETVLARLDEFDGLVIRSRFRLTKEILTPLKNVKFIARFGAGMENIDIEFAEEKGIRCLHGPEGNRDAVAEHAIGMLLCLFNNILRADKEVREGKWIREGNRGVELTGKTVGVIGYGNMGSTFVKRLQGFDVNILVYDKYKKSFGVTGIKETSLQDIFDNADIISLHVPLTTETDGMVNWDFFSKFRKEIYLINTARGKVVKTAALASALIRGKVKGACLDVQEIEDVSFEKIDEKGKDAELVSAYQYLLSSDKVVLTPHIAGWTHESNEKIAQALFEKIVAAIKS